MTIQNSNTAPKSATIEAHNKNIAYYEGIVSNIVQDEKGERKLLAARITTIIEREIFTGCNIEIFNDESLEEFNTSLYENSQLHSLSAFSTAIVDDSSIDLSSLQDTMLFTSVFDDAQALIDEQNLIADNDDLDDDLELDLSDDNTALALKVQAAFDEMPDVDKVEVLYNYDYHVDLDPMNYFIISDYLADKLRSLGQSVPNLEGLNVMINCEWSLTENSDLIAIAEKIEYDVEMYTDLINTHNTEIGKLRQE